MIWKNKKETFAVRCDNMMKGECGKMVRILPCVDFWWDETLCIGISWIFVSFEFWFGDMSELY